MSNSLPVITSPFRLSARKIIARGFLRGQLESGRSALWTKRKQRYFVLPGDYVGAMNAQFGCYEQEEINVLRWVLNNCFSTDQLRNAAMLDVGAHLANYSVELGRQFSKVVAVEASPVLSKVAHANMLWNGLSNDQTLMIAKAVSDQPGFVNFEHNQDGNLGGSRIAQDQASNTQPIASAEKIQHSVEVPTITLQAIGELAGAPIRFIKLDVEGHEIAALRSGAQLIAKHQPVMQIEVSPENFLAFEKIIGELLPGNSTFVVTHHPLNDESKLDLVKGFFTRSLHYRLAPIERVNIKKRLRALIVIPRSVMDASHHKNWAQA
jgi:FkbM family methyltransferase